MEAWKTFENLSDAEKIKFFEALTKNGPQPNASLPSTSQEQASAGSSVNNLATFVDQLAKKTIADSENPATETKAKQKTLDGWLIKRSSSKAQPKATADSSETVSPATPKKSNADPSSAGENQTEKSRDQDGNANEANLLANNISPSTGKTLLDNSSEVPQKEFSKNVTLSASPDKNKPSNSSKNLTQKGVRQGCELGTNVSQSHASKKNKKSEDVLVNIPSVPIVISETVSCVSSSNPSDSLSTSGISGQNCSKVNFSQTKMSTAPKKTKRSCKANKANDLACSDLIFSSSHDDVNFCDDSLSKQICPKSGCSQSSTTGSLSKKSNPQKKLKNLVSDDENVNHQNLISKPVDANLNCKIQRFTEEPTPKGNMFNAGKKEKRKSLPGTSNILVAPKDKKSESIKKTKSSMNVPKIDSDPTCDEIPKLNVDSILVQKENNNCKTYKKPKKSSKLKSILKNDPKPQDSPKKLFSEDEINLKTPPKSSITEKSKSAKTDASVVLDLSGKFSSDIRNPYSNLEKVINEVASGQYLNATNCNQKKKSITPKNSLPNSASKPDDSSADDISSSGIQKSSCDDLSSDLDSSFASDPNKTDQNSATVKNMTNSNQEKKSITPKKLKYNSTSKPDTSADDIHSSSIPKSSCDNSESDPSGSFTSDTNKIDQKDATVKNTTNSNQKKKSITPKKPKSTSILKSAISSDDDSSCSIPKRSCEDPRSDLNGSFTSDPNQTGQKDPAVKNTKPDKKSKSVKIISPPIPTHVEFSPFELLGLQPKSAASDGTEKEEEIVIATPVIQSEEFPVTKRSGLGTKPKVLSSGKCFQESPPEPCSDTPTLSSDNEITSEQNTAELTTSTSNKKSYNLRGKRKFAKKLLDSNETDVPASKKPRTAGAIKSPSDPFTDTSKKEVVSGKDIFHDRGTLSSEESDLQVFARISNLCSKHGLSVQEMLQYESLQNFLSQHMDDDALGNTVLLIGGHVSSDEKLVPVVNMHPDRLILTEKLLELLNSQKS